MSPKAGYLLQEQVVPRLRSAIPNAVSFVGSEDPEELIQDATAMAAKLLHNVEAAGKQVTPGNIAYYTIQHIKSGRRSTGSTQATALGTGTQLCGRTRLTSLDEPAALEEEGGGEIFAFHDVLSNDQEDPSIAAARKLDWEVFVGKLSSREQLLMEYVAEGRTLRDVSKKLRLSDSALQNIKRKLVQALSDFMGLDILIEVQRRPRWKDSLKATKEKLACKRQH